MRHQILMRSLKKVQVCQNRTIRDRTNSGQKKKKTSKKWKASNKPLKYFFSSNYSNLFGCLSLRLRLSEFVQLGLFFKALDDILTTFWTDLLFFHTIKTNLGQKKKSISGWDLLLQPCSLNFHVFLLFSQDLKKVIVSDIRWGTVHIDIISPVLSCTYLVHDKRQPPVLYYPPR